MVEQPVSGSAVPQELGAARLAKEARLVNASGVFRELRSALLHSVPETPNFEARIIADLQSN